jgi:hypothetical protein
VSPAPPQGHSPPLQQQFFVGKPQDATYLSSTSRELPLLRSPNPLTPTSQPESTRYNPYQSSYLSQRPETHVSHPSDQSHPRRPASSSPIIREAQRGTLPPVQPSSSNYAVTLPSVADLVRFNEIRDRDPPKTILERLKHGDSSVHHSLTTLVALLWSWILWLMDVGCIGPYLRTRRFSPRHDLHPSRPTPHVERLLPFRHMRTVISTYT